MASYGQHLYEEAHFDAVENIGEQSRTVGQGIPRACVLKVLEGHFVDGPSSAANVELDMDFLGTLLLKVWRLTGNGLFVHITPIHDHFVLSSTEPHLDNASSPPSRLGEQAYLYLAFAISKSQAF